MFEASPGDSNPQGRKAPVAPYGPSEARPQAMREAQRGESLTPHHLNTKPPNDGRLSCLCSLRGFEPARARVPSGHSRAERSEAISNAPSAARRIPHAAPLHTAPPNREAFLISVRESVGGRFTLGASASNRLAQGGHPQASEPNTRFTPKGRFCIKKAALLLQNR